MPSVIRGDDNFDSANAGGTTAGDVGTYAFLRQFGNNKAQVTFGGTLAGSSLYPTSMNNSTSGGPYWGITGSLGTAVSGTWQCMGFYDPTTSANDNPVTLFVRIS